MRAKQAKAFTASIGVDAGTLETKISARHHRFSSDEAPPKYDSADAHPDPYDYILAGLAACTLISIRLSAEAKQYPLERAEVEVSFKRRSPAAEGGQADHISRSIALYCDLSDRQRLSLMRAGNCAAYKNTATGMPITTEAAR